MRRWCESTVPGLEERRRAAVRMGGVVVLGAIDDGVVLLVHPLYEMMVRFVGYGSSAF